MGAVATVDPPPPSLTVSRMVTAAAPLGGMGDTNYSPASALKMAALSVASQVNDGSSRPKWP